MKLGQAVFWTLLSIGFTYAMKLLGNITLARMLSAESFGLVAIVFAITNGIEAITDVGNAPSLIRSHRTDDAWLNTSWTLALIRGFAIAIVIALIAYPIALFFNDMRLVPMIAVSGLMSVMIGAKSNQSILAVRDLKSKTLAMLDFWGVVAGYIVMLTWAWLAPSAWALLAGAMVSCFVGCSLTFFAFEHRKHSLCWDQNAVRELVSFGKWVFFASLLGFVILQGDRIVIGKFRGMHDVGIYSIAITWSAALHQLFNMFLSRLYLPVVAQFKRLQSGILAVARLRYFILSAMIIPYAFLAGASDQFIAFLYPASFSAAGIVMGVLVIGAWFSGIEFIHNDQLMLEGEPAWRAYAQLLSIVVMAASLIAFLTQATLLTVAIIFAGGAVLRGTMLLIISTRKHFRYGLPDLGITALFLGLSFLVKTISAALAAKYSALVALAVCGAVLAPFGAVIAWMAIKRALALAAGLSIEPEANTTGPLAGQA